MKKVLSLFALFALAAVALSAPALAVAEEMFVVYAQVPADWEHPCVWAWSDDGTNAFASWPGCEMDADPANEGWYYAYLPGFASHVIINANNGSVQTADHDIAGASWITVSGADAVEVSGEALTQGEAPAYVETFPIHARVPESWEGPGLWAWLAPEGTNAFAAWPGKAMSDQGDGWFTAKAPVWVNAIIINALGGSVQTADIEIDPAELWLTGAEDGSYDFTYNDPDAKEAEAVTVHVKAPADWESPCLWAWSAPDGTNVFLAWPGEPLQATEGADWLTLQIPGWANSVIVNGNGGSVQTADISVEAGRDLYLTVTAADAYELAYEAP